MWKRKTDKLTNRQTNKQLSIQKDGQTDDYKITVIFLRLKDNIQGENWTYNSQIQRLVM